MDTIAQWISMAGLVCICLSYLQKKKSALILCQLFGAVLFGIHYFMLEAYAGFLLNTIAVFRALVFYKDARSQKAGKIWVGVFIGLFLLAYALTFLVFGTEPTTTNLIFELIPVIGVCIATFSFNMTGAKQIRALSTFNSAGWLTYNIFHHSVGGTLCEIISLSSIVVGMLLHDIKKKPPKT